MAPTLSLRNVNNLDLVRAIVAAALLLASMPSMIGVTIVNSNSGPSFTADICHPLQTVVNASGVSLTALLPAQHMPDPPAVCDDTELQTTLPSARPAEAPDPPPPRPRV